MQNIQLNVTGRRYARNKELAAYIGVTSMCLWRWKRDPELQFPPAAEINGIEYNDLNLIDEWLRKRAVDRTLRREVRAANRGA